MVDIHPEPPCDPRSSIFLPNNPRSRVGSPALSSPLLLNPGRGFSRPVDEGCSNPSTAVRFFHLMSCRPTPWSLNPCTGFTKANCRSRLSCRLGTTVDCTPPSPSLPFVISPIVITPILRNSIVVRPGRGHIQESHPITCSRASSLSGVLRAWFVVLRHMFAEIIHCNLSHEPPRAETWLIDRAGSQTNFLPSQPSPLMISTMLL